MTFTFRRSVTLRLLVVPIAVIASYTGTKSSLSFFWINLSGESMLGSSFTASATGVVHVAGPSLSQCLTWMSITS